MINLDANASYGAIPEALGSITALNDSVLNPSSVHRGGQRARAVIEETREKLAEIVGLGGGDRVVFTSGATESNNWAVRAGLRTRAIPRPCFLTTEIEHPSILELIPSLERDGIRCLVAPVGRIPDAGDGPVDLASFMTANNETGEILPVRELADAVRREHPDALIHTDAVQALGKIPLRFRDLGVDLMSVSAHKIGGIAGVGALIVGKGVKLPPGLVGGPQESRHRAGTENVFGIAAFGAALDRIRGRIGERGRAMAGHRAFLEARLGAIPAVRVNFTNVERLPNTMSVTVDGVHADDLVVALDLEGVLVSSGAACASGKPEPSHVLLALGFGEDEASRTVRISVKAEYRPGDLDEAAEAFERCVLRMRAVRGAA